MKRKNDVTVTVRGSALKKPVILSITNNCNKVCIYMPEYICTYIHCMHL